MKWRQKIFKTQVEPRAAGEWFHCQVLDILWRHFMVYKIAVAFSDQTGPTKKNGS